MKRRVKKTKNLSFFDRDFTKGTLIALLIIAAILSLVTIGLGLSLLY